VENALAKSLIPYKDPLFQDFHRCQSKTSHEHETKLANNHQPNKKVEEKPEEKINLSQNTTISRLMKTPLAF